MENSKAVCDICGCKAVYQAKSTVGKKTEYRCGDHNWYRINNCEISLVENETEVSLTWIPEWCMKADILTIIWSYNG